MAHDDTQCPRDDLYWKLTINENGWQCGFCGGPAGGEPPGYRPDLDRDDEMLYRKIEGILAALHDAEFLYVSNGSEGDSICLDVAARCKKRGKFDQYTIIQQLFTLRASHGDYWKRIGDGVVNGADVRDRCECGRLATCSRGSERYCREHTPSRDLF